MTTSNHTSITTFTRDDERKCNVDLQGAFNNAPQRADVSSVDLHSVSVHDVLKVTRRTKVLPGGTKVTVVTVHTETGNVEINCFIKES